MSVSHVLQLDRPVVPRSGGHRLRGSHRQPLEARGHRQRQRVQGLEQGRRKVAAELLERIGVRPEGLRGGFSYWDAQVDDYRLVRAVIASAIRDGAVVRENTKVESLRKDGTEWVVRTAADESRFDLVVNAAGPWMNEYLAANAIRASYVLSLIRGSHIVLRRRVADPGAPVLPYLMSGGTDAKHFRKLGMRSYGFAPLRLPADLDFTALFHGVDERVPVDALEFGARVFDRFLDRA